jgi:hypothetical protein
MNISKVLFSKASIKCAIIAAYIAFLVAIDLPIKNYLSNLSEFNFPVLDILINLAPLFLVIFLVLLLPILVPSRIAKNIYFGFLSAIALIAWVQSYFLFGDYGLLNGESLTINDRGYYAYSELFVCFLIVFLLCFNSKLAAATGDLVVGIFTLTLLYDIYLLGSSPDSTPWQKLWSSISLEKLDQASFDNLAHFSTSQNIVHILLDELQTDVIEQVLSDKPALSEDFDGFTFFPNTSSVYPYTEMSLPAILSGKTYDNSSSKSRYLDESINDNQFITALDSADYSIKLHLHPAYCNEKYFTHCTVIPGISVRLAALDLVDLGFFRSSPIFLKQAIYNNGNGVIKAFFSFDNYSASQPGIGYVLFDEFNNNFKVDDIPPVYTFYQSLITHSPMVLDSECSVSDENMPLEIVYMKRQAECALKQVGRFLQNLKDYSIYDRTLVVISSDHGGNFFDQKQNSALAEASIPQKHFARGKSTLLIKPFDSRGALTKSNYPAQVSDIPMTVSALASLNFKGSGANIFEKKYDILRERDYHFIQPHFATKKLDRFENLKTYRISGDVKKASSWRIVDGRSEPQ